MADSTNNEKFIFRVLYEKLKNLNIKLILSEDE